VQNASSTESSETHLATVTESTITAPLVVEVVSDSTNANWYQRVGVVALPILGSFISAIALAFDRHTFEGFRTLPAAFSPGNQLLWIFIIAAFAFMGHRTLLALGEEPLAIRPTLWCTVLFSLALTVGGAIDSTTGSLAALASTWQRLLASIFVFVGYAYILAMLCAGIFVWNARRMQGKSSLGLGAAPPRGPISRLENQLISAPRKVALVGFLVLLGVYVTYWAVFFPGVVTRDSEVQIQQILGELAPNNHHPFMHTLLIASIFRSVLAISGNVNWAVGAFTLVQVFFISALIIFVLWRARVWGVPASGLLAAYALFLFYPVAGIYAVTVWKDIPFAYAMMLWLVLVVDLVRSHGRLLRSWRWIVPFGLASMGVEMMRSVGPFIVISGVITLIILFRRNLLRIVLVTLIPFSISFFGTGVVHDLFGVSPGQSREALSIPLQQIARAARYNGENFTPEQQEFVRSVFPDFTVAEIGERYSWFISDPVKNFADSRGFIDPNMGDFLRGWLDIGINNPASYVTSFVSGGSGYWFPQFHWVTQAQVRGEDVGGVTGLVTRSNILENFSPEVRAFEGFLLNPQSIPGYSVFWLIGFWVWLAVIGIVAMLQRGRQRLAIAVGVPLGVLWLTSLASPVFSEFRYMYGLVVMVPVVLLLGLSRMNDDEPDPVRLTNND